jgi:hypothetical protein
MTCILLFLVLFPTQYPKINSLFVLRFFKNLNTYITFGVNCQLKQTNGQIVEPEVAVAVGNGLPILASAAEKAPCADNNLFLFRVIDRSGDELSVCFGNTPLEKGRFPAALQSRPRCSLSVPLTREHDGVGGAGLHARGSLYPLSSRWAQPVLFCASLYSVFI